MKCRGLTCQSGFTMIELLVTLFVLLSLFGIATLVAHEKDYRPQLRNAERQLEVAQILQAVTRYARDNSMLPPGVTAKPATIGTQSKELNWCASLAPQYITDIPIDPTIGGSLNKERCKDAKNVFTAGYTVAQAADGTVTVAAPVTDLDERISVSRKP